MKKLYNNELRKYFSGVDYNKLSTLFNSGSSEPVKVQSDEGKWYMATYDSGKQDGYGWNSAIRFKLAKEKENAPV